MGDFGTYSFHETKNYSMGEGGALLIRDASKIEEAEIIREKGTNRSKFFRGQIDKYTWVNFGSSYLPSDMNAAYLYAQLEMAEEINEARLAVWNRYYEGLKELKENGKIDELIDKWYGETEPEENIPLEELKANEKTLNVSIDTTRKPFVYMYEGKPVGFEIEVLYMFCKEYGYNVNISDVSFASGLAGLASEKYDLVCGGLYMTPERKESVNFSNPYMNAEVVMAKCERSGFDNSMFCLSSRYQESQRRYEEC